MTISYFGKSLCWTPETGNPSRPGIDTPLLDSLTGKALTGIATLGIGDGSARRSNDPSFSLQLSDIGNLPPGLPGNSRVTLTSNLNTNFAVPMNGMFSGDNVVVTGLKLILSGGKQKNRTIEACGNAVELTFTVTQSP